MRLSYGMKLEQTQKLIMTPELRQAIMVLQLSSMVSTVYRCPSGKSTSWVSEEAEDKPPADKNKDDFARSGVIIFLNAAKIDRSFDRAGQNTRKERTTSNILFPKSLLCRNICT